MRAQILVVQTTRPHFSIVPTLRRADPLYAVCAKWILLHEDVFTKIALRRRGRVVCVRAKHHRMAALERWSANMQTDFRIGDRVQLSERGRRRARTPVRSGVICKLAKSGTQCRVRWDGTQSLQLIHFSFIERVASSDTQDGCNCVHPPHLQMPALLADVADLA